MINRQLWFDREGQPIDAETANSRLGDEAYWRVGLTVIRSRTAPEIEYRVSTVWLGVNHEFGDGPPVLFETMVFGAGDDWAERYMQRYSTEAEAQAGHAETVQLVAATVPDEELSEGT